MRPGLLPLLLLTIVLAAAAPGHAASRRAHAAVPQQVRPTAPQEAWIRQHVPSSQRAELEAIGREIGRTGTLSPMADRRWRGVVTRLAESGAHLDVNALVQWVMREGYLEQTADLAHAAEKVQHFNEQKKAIRDELGGAGETRSESSPESTGKTTRAKPGVRPPIEGNVLRKAPVRTSAMPNLRMKTNELHVKTQDGDAREKAREPSRLPRTKRPLQSTGSELGSTDEDAQLKTIELQNALQKQQQTLQMLSNISKTMHDAASSIIRKLGD